MSMSALVVIGILFVAWVFIKRVLPMLIVRQVSRFALKKVGENAMAKVPADPVHSCGCAAMAR